MARRRWIADRQQGARAWLTGANADHLARVLRAQVGQEFEVATGSEVYLGRITAIMNGEVEFALMSQITVRESQPETTLLLAVFKFDRFEWALEKAVELGVNRLVPVIAARTEKHLAAAASKRVERWGRVAKEAAQQSRRAYAAEIDDPLDLERAMGAFGGTRIVLSEEERDASLWQAMSGQRDATIVLAVGPEGGWTAAELAGFRQAGWKEASLGPTILRAETAVVATLAVVAQARLESNQATG